ncbi:5-formyltetrahydrofolate cyclo-ligase [uncultured Brachyspira sp.]|uniref:5-formyltetrahydrofolate cyclo-ligase n=1 Tax=uncultured Brachyspira sp. TaxID=221953 RepID=UPI0025CCFA13|nr:5-formyltetrahydrofolate cyclo-ligase [uncultured Brachyspira sp.]
MAIEEEKRILRKSLKLIRSKLDSKFIESRAIAITNKFFSIVDINKFREVCLYIDFANEVPTKNIIEKLLNKNIKVSVPYIIDDHNMKLKYIEDYNKDINFNTKFGNGEPFLHCKDCNIEEISMFIIPALGFDEHCNRIGFGRGYYDNILKENRNALRIGLSYDYQILPILPKDDNDEILDIIISENKVITAIF